MFWGMETELKLKILVTIVKRRGRGAEGRGKGTIVPGGKDRLKKEPLLKV